MAIRKLLNVWLFYDITDMNDLLEGRFISLIIAQFNSKEPVDLFWSTYFDLIDTTNPFMPWVAKTTRLFFSPKHFLKHFSRRNAAEKPTIHNPTSNTLSLCA